MQIEELAVQARREDPQAAAAEETPAAETTAATEQSAQPPAAPTATASIGRALDPSLACARQPRVLPEPAAPGTGAPQVITPPSCAHCQWSACV
ncbi:hypothetical protein [Streptomyces nigra]